MTSCNETQVCGLTCIRLDQLREHGLYVETGKTGKRLLFTWDDKLRTAINDTKALRHRVISLYLFNSPRDGAPMTQSNFKSRRSKYMRAAMKEGSIIERFAENDLRAKVATEAIGLRQNVSALPGHSSDLMKNLD